LFIILLRAQLRGRCLTTFSCWAPHLNPLKYQLWLVGLVVRFKHMSTLTEVVINGWPRKIFACLPPFEGWGGFSMVPTEVLLASPLIVHIIGMVIIISWSFFFWFGLNYLILFLLFLFCVPMIWWLIYQVDEAGPSFLRTSTTENAEVWLCI